MCWRYAPTWINVLIFNEIPNVVPGLAETLPFSHFVRLIRGIMLRGVDILELWPDLVALLVFEAVLEALVILRFSKRLDRPLYCSAHVDTPPILASKATFRVLHVFAWVD
ncbi:P-loop NTPase family protein [Microbulbifer agarilyticus]|uniref:hypothetical protein n=1 Tax=Microbulbifer agarilyticus TaxID=260552 RepID=UPI001CD3CD43|nr:hypothetical protein [Microbulbifer agarilyticus]MCA0899406.1 hypothetical protein [Microbulbifer agarilyticus]